MLYRTGQKFIATIYGYKRKKIRGVICVNDDDTVHLCQNTASGFNEAENLFGYLYSWRLDSNVDSIRTFNNNLEKICTKPDNDSQPL